MGWGLQQGVTHRPKKCGHRCVQSTRRSFHHDTAARQGVLVVEGERPCTDQGISGLRELNIACKAWDASLWVGVVSSKTDVQSGWERR